MILQLVFSVPLIACAFVLWLRFKYFFSLTNMKNIQYISALMLFENSINCILRFFVGVKQFLSSPNTVFLPMVNFAMPLIFAIFWSYVCYISQGKNGHYGAPISMLKE